MVQITLSDEQTRLIAEAGSPVFLTDPQGRVVGQASQLSEQDAADIRLVMERMANAEAKGDPGKWYTTEEVLAHLRSLAPE